MQILHWTISGASVVIISLVLLTNGESFDIFIEGLYLNWRWDMQQSPFFYLRAHPCSYYFFKHLCSNVEKNKFVLELSLSPFVHFSFYTRLIKCCSINISLLLIIRWWKMLFKSKIKWTESCLGFFSLEWIWLRNLVKKYMNLLSFIIGF